MHNTMRWPVLLAFAVGLGCSGSTGDDTSSSSGGGGSSSSSGGLSRPGSSSNAGGSSTQGGSSGVVSSGSNATSQFNNSSTTGSSQGGSTSTGNSSVGSTSLPGSSGSSGVVGSSSGGVSGSSAVVSSGGGSSSSGVAGSSGGGGSSSSGGPAVENCAQAGDEDGDQLPDCVDPDCQGNAACVAGNTPLGGACTQATDCQATGGDPLCFTGTFYPGGYCSQGCTTPADCGANARCVAMFGPTAPVGACVAQCTPGPTACRTGYECNVIGPSGVCVGAETDTLCTNLADDDGDGRADCADPSCRTGNNCQVGLGQVGTPCTAANQCSATDNDPACLGEATNGYPAGYCAEFCDAAANGAGGTNVGCSAQGVCVNFTDADLCLDACTVPADCRQGYTCRDFNGVRGCFPACTANTDCPATTYCERNTNSPNLGFCTPPPVCGNGLLQGDEQCDPPDALGCNASCTLQELDCNNLTDDDNDQLFDCQDPDCAAACTPGSTPTGGPCTANTDCAATGNDPLCFTDAAFPQGYCAEFCTPGGTPGTGTGCTGDAVCRDLGNGLGVCYDRCTTQQDCRAGYACGTEERGTPNAYSVCFPAEDDAVACADGADNDGNGTPDCMDPACKALSVCTPGATAAGQGCTANNNCAATTGADPFCYTEAEYGFPNGACSEWCNPQDANPGCANGFTCVAGPANPAVGTCRETCVQGQTTCRAGYTCEALTAPATGFACAPGCTTNTQCASNKCYTAGGFCLTVPATWTCSAAYYGGGPSDGCDCGCGAVDFDCGANPTITTCGFCHCSGTSASDCPEQVNPQDIGQCL